MANNSFKYQSSRFKEQVKKIILRDICIALGLLPIFMPIFIFSPPSPFTLDDSKTHYQLANLIFQGSSIVFSFMAIAAFYFMGRLDDILMTFIREILLKEKRNARRPLISDLIEVETILGFEYRQKILLVLFIPPILSLIVALFCSLFALTYSLSYTVFAIYSYIYGLTISAIHVISLHRILEEARADLVMYILSE